MRKKPKVSKNSQKDKMGYKDNSPYNKSVYNKIQTGGAVTMEGVGRNLVATDGSTTRSLPPNGGNYRFSRRGVMEIEPQTLLSFEPYLLEIHLDSLSEEKQLEFLEKYEQLNESMKMAAIKQMFAKHKDHLAQVIDTVSSSDSIEQQGRSVYQSGGAVGTQIMQGQVVNGREYIPISEFEKAGWTYMGVSANSPDAGNTVNTSAFPQGNTGNSIYGDYAQVQGNAAAPQVPARGVGKPRSGNATRQVTQPPPAPTLSTPVTSNPVDNTKANYQNLYQGVSDNALIQAYMAVESRGEAHDPDVVNEIRRRGFQVGSKVSFTTAITDSASGKGDSIRVLTPQSSLTNRMNTYFNASNKSGEPAPEYISYPTDETKSFKVNSKTSSRFRAMGNSNVFDPVQGQTLKRLPDGTYRILSADENVKMLSTSTGADRLMLSEGLSNSRKQNNFSTDNWTDLPTNITDRFRDLTPNGSGEFVYDPSSGSILKREPTTGKYKTIDSDVEFKGRKSLYNSVMAKFNKIKKGE